MISQEVALSEICDTGSGGTPSRAKQDIYYGGSIPWVKSGELRESVITETGESLTELGLSESSAKLLPPQTLLVALYGATVGRVGMLGIEAATNQAVCYLIPDDTRVERRYLYHALRSKVPYWLSQRVGGGQPNISQGVIKNTKIPLPPLSEQKRIAEILDRAEALRAKRRAALALLDELTQSIFLDMFGDPVSNPMGFATKKLIDVVDTERGISYGIVQRGSDVDDGIPVLRISDVIAGEIDTHLIKKTSPDIAAKYRRTVLRGGEIVISIRGTIGRCAIVPTTLCDGNISRELALIPHHGIESEFLLTLLRCDSIQRRIVGDVKGVAQRGINLKDLRELRIIIPDDDLVADFSRRITEYQRVKSGQQFSLRALDQLFASLQHRAFRGELSLRKTRARDEQL